MKTLIKISVIALAFQLTIISNSYSQLPGTKRSVDFINSDGDANDLYIIFTNAEVDIDDTGGFPNDDINGAEHHLSGMDVPKGDTVKCKFRNPAKTPIKIKEWWWTKDKKQVGKKHKDNGKNEMTWNGGNAAGNGSVMVSMSGTNSVFQSTPGFSTTQTLASFKSFVNANFNSGGRTLVHIDSLSPTKIEIGGNKLGDSTQNLTCIILNQDFNQPLMLKPYTLMELKISGMYEGFFDIFYQIGDYSRVYLRSGLPPYNVISNSVTWLDSSGNGTSLFDGTAANGINYFISVTHRNSIETYSYDGLNRFVSNQMTYDFTTGPNKAFGNNLKNKGLKWCFYSGDINQDGLIDAGDISRVDNGAFNFLTGYVDEDVNGDQLTDASDISIVDNNAFNYVMKITP